jgi:hypothetical protein
MLTEKRRASDQPKMTPEAEECRKHLLSSILLEPRVRTQASSSGLEKRVGEKAVIVRAQPEIELQLPKTASSWFFGKMQVEVDPPCHCIQCVFSGRLP